jgi:hypothetical protein
MLTESQIAEPREMKIVDSEAPTPATKLSSHVRNNQALQVTRSKSAKMFVSYRRSKNL